MRRDDDGPTERSKLGTKNPSSRLYWNDLANDQALKSCSLAAQGLWTAHLLPIAARGDLGRPGYVELAGKPCDAAHLAETLAGIVGKPAAELQPLIDELIATKAAGIDRRKVLFNRRMVRDHGISMKRSKAGVLGAAATHGNGGEIGGVPRQKVGNASGNRSGKSGGTRQGKPRGKGSGNSAGPSNLQASDTSVSSAAPSPGAARDDASAECRAAPDASLGTGDEEALDFDARRASVAACQAAGLPVERADDFLAITRAWLVKGWRIEAHIVPAIRARAARRGYEVPTSLSYFTPVVADFVAKVGIAAAAPSSPLEPREKSGTSLARHEAVFEPGWDIWEGPNWVPASDWAKRVAAFSDAVGRGEAPSPRIWRWGVPPTHHLCAAPRDVLVRFGYRGGDA